MTKKKDDARLDDIEVIYRRSFLAFLRTATAIVGDENSAADAVHDAFVSAVRSRKSFRGEGPLEAWLWKVVINAARARLRTDRARTTISLDETSEVGSNGAHPDFAQAALRPAIAALPERQRLALFLRYYADLDYESIARVLDIRPGTAAATLHAGHQNLKRVLQEVRS